MSHKDKKQTKKRKSPSAKSVEEMQLHEPIIQDRIAGMRIIDLAEKYGMHRDSITKICEKHKARIEAERKQWLRDRQEAINKAMEDDIERLTQLITESGELMLTAVQKLREKIEAADSKKLTNGQLIMAIDTAVKAFDKVRAATLAAQREAMRE